MNCVDIALDCMHTRLSFFPQCVLNWVALHPLFIARQCVHGIHIFWAVWNRVRGLMVFAVQIPKLMSKQHCVIFERNLSAGITVVLVTSFIIKLILEVFCNAYKPIHTPCGKYNQLEENVTWVCLNLNYTIYQYISVTSIFGWGHYLKVYFCKCSTHSIFVNSLDHTT